MWVVFEVIVVWLDLLVDGWEIDIELQISYVVVDVIFCMLFLILIEDDVVMQVFQVFWDYQDVQFMVNLGGLMVLLKWLCIYLVCMKESVRCIRGLIYDFVV